MKAANEFKDKTTVVNQQWQTDFTCLKIIGWGCACLFGYALHTVFPASMSPDRVYTDLRRPADTVRHYAVLKRE